MRETIFSRIFANMQRSQTFLRAKMCVIQFSPKMPAINLFNYNFHHPRLIENKFGFFVPGAEKQTIAARTRKCKYSCYVLRQMRSFIMPRPSGEERYFRASKQLAILILAFPYNPEGLQTENFSGCKMSICSVI